jgi:hypothetical protein
MVTPSYELNYPAVIYGKQGEQLYPTIMDSAPFPTTVPLMGEADYPIAAATVSD